MDKTKIDWCDSTWNPVTGCLHGCEYCYARGIANRFGTLNKGDILPEDEGLEFVPNTPETFLVLDKPVRNENGKIEPYPSNFYPTFHKYRLNEYQNKKGRNIFVCSMADLFGDWVPDKWIQEVFAACHNAPQHNYLFLTKNPKRYLQTDLPLDDNLWYGTSICRKDDIAKCRYLPFGRKKFVSIEPILEDLELTDSSVINYVDWVIIGAETGRRKNKVIPERKWIEDIVNECRKADIPVFMKSSLSDIWGGPLMQEFPEELKRK